MRQIEKPEVTTKVIDKKTLWFNIRESRLMFMFHRNLITMNEYESGSRYRRMCEIATLGTGSSMQDNASSRCFWAGLFFSKVGIVCYPFGVIFTN